MQKEQTSSPAVSNQPLFISYVIDAKERKDVGTVDVPGVFFQTKNEGEVFIQMDQQMAIQLAWINPKYTKDMVEVKGQKVIYRKANKPFMVHWIYHYYFGKTSQAQLANESSATTTMDSF